MTRRGTQVSFWVGLLLVGVLLLYLLSTILLPFVAGAALAFLLDPLADRLERWRVPRAAAAVLLVGVFFGVALLLVLALLPTMIDQVVRFIGRLPELIEAARRTLNPVLQTLREQFGAAGGGGADASERAVDWAGNVLSGVLGGGLAFFSVLSLLLITPVVAFFLLRDWDLLVARIDSWLPPRHAETIRQLARETDEVLGGFVRGQAMVCAVQGTFYALALTTAGLDYGLLIGFGSGAMAFIPYIGATLGFVISMLVSFFQEGSTWPWMALIAFIYLFGQFAESNFLTPKLVGDRVRLHPVWVIFALLAFGVLFGFVGVLLAVPIAAVLGVLVRFFMRQYLQSSFFLGRQPPAEP